MTDFEKWWSVPRNHRDIEAMCEAAYNAGREAGLREAAEVCEPYKDWDMFGMPNHAVHLESQILSLIDK